MRTFIASLVFATSVLAASASVADFKVTEANETCRNAHAVLVASASGKDSYIWGEIKKVARSNRDKWELVDEHEPGVVRRISLRQYEVRGRSGASAYVVHCGHGGTCNTLTQAFFKEHPDWYSPEVFCGTLPAVFESPRRP